MPFTSSSSQLILRLPGPFSIIRVAKFSTFFEKSADASRGKRAGMLAWPRIITPFSVVTFCPFTEPATLPPVFNGQVDDH